MRKMLIALSLIAMISWSFTLPDNGPFQACIGCSNDSVYLEEGRAFDSAWSAHRKVLAAGVNQGRSMDLERYTIQVFSGKRMEASQWFGRLRDSLGPQQVMLHFDEPNFKVSVGLYPIRLAAEHELRRWRRHFPQAFVVRAPDVEPGK